jgi:ribosomal protein S7
MDILSVVVLILKIAYQGISWLSRRQMLNEGAQQQIATELLKIAKASGTAKTIRAEVEKMSDAELDNALGGDFRD